MATRAAINIRGDGDIMDITSLGRDDIAVAHPSPGLYLVAGTLGMCPPPEGWGYVINQLDAGASVTMSFTDGLLMVSVVKEGAPSDLAHSITLHVCVEDLPEPEMPQPPAPEPVDPLLMAEAESARLRAIADAAIAPLQDAVDLDDATPSEIDALKAWKRYRVALNRLPEQPGFPETLDWPDLPA